MTTYSPLLPLPFSFPEFIDNTSRSMVVSCPLKWIYGNLYSIAPAEPSIHLHAGGTFAAGLEAVRRAYFEQGLDEPSSLKKGLEAARAFWGDFEAPEDSPKSLPRVLDAILEYFTEYPISSDPVTPLKVSDSKRAIEFRFSVPLPFTHPDTGNPLTYCGRFDMLGEFNGALFAVDEKTASQLGAQWMNQWELDSQFTGYCWAAQQYSFPVAGAIIRGISFLKGKFGHAQAIIYRPEWVIKRWYDNLLWDVEQMLALYERVKSNAFIPQTLDKSTCGAYGGCAYKRLCESPSPANWLPSFTKREWDPLAKA